MDLDLRIGSGGAGKRHGTERYLFEYSVVMYGRAWKE